ncbi:sugar ABC transporter permease [Halolactibacillus alkaliphilus]|uniref:Sugar ABC transporter permease n=2 Tax=Halolactibacillus alkaliphilus TaxID=442899 RepID=A0A511X216_9BACI|nr:sugar ABC transporter permease [Halolactibacillus alkaliphilus]GGN71639.1 sugar ABC transporter permease [Halolactibacillus alkaliphilus]SFO84942.1 carbohydrate ABC transporter membrane protein 1, CUT1 family (TC 3.A.1.1.-) [Halolactibacillus alkaliphilus]
MMDKKNTRVYLMMVLPALVLFFSFHTFPLLQGIFYSFTDYRGYGDWNFIGIDNYINVFRDPRILNSYQFTFKFAIVSTVLVNIISLTVALGLNSKVKFHKTLRGIYFMPNILSILIVGFVFKFIFSVFIPEIGQSFGIEGIAKSILGNRDYAWIAIVIVGVWQAAALNVILYLSGLATIPEDLYEASGLDGASKWQQFRHVTFPLIAPFFTINMVLAMKNFLMVFDHVVALTGGGPGRSTQSISLLIYQDGFTGGQFALQSANAVVYFFVIVTISIIQIRFLQKREVQL